MKHMRGGASVRVFFFFLLLTIRIFYRIHVLCTQGTVYTTGIEQTALGLSIIQT